MKRRLFIVLLVVAAGLVAGVFLGNRMSEAAGESSSAVDPRTPDAMPVRKNKRVVLVRTNGAAAHTNAIEEPVSNNEDLVAVPVPNEKKRFIADAWKRYPASTNVSNVENIRRRRARVDLLSQSLTPGELLYYRLNDEPYARLLRDRFYEKLLMPLSEAEFTQLYLALEFSGLSNESSHDIFSQEQEESMKEVLSPEMYKLFLERADPNIKPLLMFAWHCGLDSDGFDQLVELRTNTPPIGDREAYGNYSNRVYELTGNVGRTYEFLHLYAHFHSTKPAAAVPE